MTLSKKIVAITVVAASGVMGLDVKNMDTPASVSEQQRLRELRSRSSRSRSRSRTSTTTSSNTIRGTSMGGMTVAAAAVTLSPAARAAADRIPKDKTAEEIVEVLKKEQSFCKDVAKQNPASTEASDFTAPTEAPTEVPTEAPTEAPKPVCPSKSITVEVENPKSYSESGILLPSSTRLIDLPLEKYCDNEKFQECLNWKISRENFNSKAPFFVDPHSECESVRNDIYRDLDIKRAEADSALEELLDEAGSHPWFTARYTCTGRYCRQLQFFDSLDMNMNVPSNSEETCLQQITDIQQELCSAGSETAGSYQNRFSCDDARTVCAAAGVHDSFMPQCGETEATSYLDYLWYAIAGLVILGFAGRRIKCCGGRNGSCFGGNAANKIAAAEDLEKPQPVAETPQPVVVFVSESAKMNIEMEKLRLANEELKVQKADLESRISTTTSEPQAMKARIEV